MDHVKTQEKDARNNVSQKVIYIALSAVLPLLILLIRPFEMDMRQSATLAVLLLVIIWWCTGIVGKTLASCVLIVSFLLLSGAQPRTVFSFPLSSTFLLIVLTYLFSRGVANSGLAEKYLEPVFTHVASTPFKAVILGALMLVVTIYAIPQPLARLIIISDIVRAYLEKTDADEAAKSTVIFGVFVMYIFVNMLTMNADIILNTTSAAVAGVQMTDGEWMSYMAAPSVAYTAAVLLLFRLIFKKELAGKKLHSLAAKAEKKPLGKIDVATLLIVVVTMLLWLTESIHGIPSWVVTLCSIALMYITGALKLVDIKAIDVPMLVFLTAAMSIGAVMSENGTAELIFSRLRALIDGGSPAYTVLAVVLITVCMHMLLGSNTTTVSVVIPSIMYMCEGMLPAAVIMFIVYVASAAQWLFPFHSVGLMMGTSMAHFTPKHVLRLGIPLTALLFAAIFGLYLPWWKFIGAL